MTDHRGAQSYHHTTTGHSLKKLKTQNIFHIIHVHVYNGTYSLIRFIYLITSISYIHVLQTNLARLNASRP